MSAKIFDPAAFVETLIKQLPSDESSLKKECYIINDSKNDPDYQKLHPKRFRFLAVTIETNDHHYGWMGLFSFNMNEIFRQSELKLLKSPLCVRVVVASIEQKSLQFDRAIERLHDNRIFTGV